jgi:PhzF family phenazine biosynthesis protein
MSQSSLHRFAAFTTTPSGGNPAGVWVGEALPDAASMQRIAAEVGFSETAFVAPTHGTSRTVRYYSPAAEVSFCGHATIASGVYLGGAAGADTYQFSTAVGVVPVVVQMRNGYWEASLTSVQPKHEIAGEELVSEALSILGWRRSELERDIAPVRAYAGAWHLILAAADRRRLDTLEYDFEKLKALMLDDDLTTLELLWRERGDLFHARGPFPVGGVVEDPATGAAAAARGGSQRDANWLEPPARIQIRQGEAMGRPSLLTVDIPSRGGIFVTGTAVLMEA